MQTLIKTLRGENGELYTLVDGRRLLLAKCVPKIEIYEYSQTVNTPRTRGYKVKSINVGVVICAERETTRDVDVDFLRTVTRFEFVGDFQREDGIFERIKFNNLSPNELDLSGDWEFEVIGQADLVQKLTKHF